MRIGLISFAHTGHANSYAKALLDIPGVKVAGVYDDDAERAEAAASRFKTARFGDYAELLDQVDAVVICSENKKHYPLAMEAARAGKHILVEKPITTVGEEARELIDLCASMRLVLQTAFPVRVNASVQKAKRQIEAGDIGDIVAIAATNHGKMPGGWFTDPELAGGGAVLDHTVHVVDLMRWFLQSEVKEVYAEAGTLLHDIPVDDCGLLSMTFENGVIATLDTSWSRPESFPIWGDVTMRFIGTKGALHLDVFSQNGSIWENGAANTHRYIGWGDNSNAALVEEFVASIRENRDTAITGLDGLRAAEVAWAAYESARSNDVVQVKHY
nr:Gfo/Idh/MocA family oxidoreductase [Paenibacillus hamazuiensis]